MRIPGVPPDSDLAQTASQLILCSFDDYQERFAAITLRARGRFEKRDWPGIRADSVERMDLYEKILSEVADKMRSLLMGRLQERSLWLEIKAAFPGLMKGRHDLELAETFYNSVTRKVMSTVGLDREIEYFRLVSSRCSSTDVSTISTRHPAGRPTEQIVREVLESQGFHCGYEDLARDSASVAREIDLHLWPIIGYGDFEAIEMIRSPFFRNKVAYLVGRVCIGKHSCLPLVLPLYHGDQGIYVDTALLSERDVSVVFSFAFSYFLVEIDRHDVLIQFIRNLLPEKPIAELYVSIGYNKHGKTEFYRDLHRFVHRAREQFFAAPGREGSVMIVFTLPNYDFVFKVIKDFPCYLRSSDQTSKTTDRQAVMERYNLVRHRDRVGRMVDTQEFENLRFRRWRFSEQLLEEFALAAREAITLEAQHVVIHHLYVQRRVTPLLMYLVQEKDPELIRRVVLDFGYFLKDLAATGIFPSDLFNIWNYGVTRRGRVVLYDYDDVWPLEKPNFRDKPLPQDEFEEMESEQEWIVAMQDDYFMDEIERFSGMPDRLRGIFRSVHADLYRADYWRDMQRRVRAGEVVDITPYDRSRRFRR
jgi:isocitrate dehydrogenase kinase/phosphatase